MTKDKLRPLAKNSVMASTINKVINKFKQVRPATYALITNYYSLFLAALNFACEKAVAPTFSSF